MPARARPPRRSRPDPRDLADRLHSAAIRLLRSLRAEDAASGVTGPRLSALSVLVFGGPRTLTGLAAAEQVRPPTMSRLVRDMEREGLLRRVPDRDDRRVQWIHPTAAGRKLLLAGRDRRVARLAADVERLSPADLRALLGGLEVIERMSRPV